MRNRYVVCYDVRDPRRLVRTHKKMLGYGDPVQYSVFACELSRRELAYMHRDLRDILNLDEDRVLIINTGDAAKESTAVSTMGAQKSVERQVAIII